MCSYIDLTRYLLTIVAMLLIPNNTIVWIMYFGSLSEAFIRQIGMVRLANRHGNYLPSNLSYWLHYSWQSHVKRTHEAAKFLSSRASRVAT